ncbi:MAG TPA: hypothetical protein VF276_18320 [Chloroflexia bacterium]
MNGLRVQRRCFTVPHVDDNHQAGEAGDNSNEAALSPEQQQRAKNAALIRLLQSWRDSDDADEQRETLAYLMRVLDEDRLSERKLFP